MDTSDTSTGKLSTNWVCPYCGETVDGVFHSCAKSPAMNDFGYFTYSVVPPGDIVLKRIDELERRVAELEKRKRESDVTP